jgi:hypothetical protein
MQRHFEQKSKYLRDVWSTMANTTQTHTAAIIPKLNKDNAQFLWIIGLTFFAILCSGSSLYLNYWTCDTARHFGIWNTCYKNTPSNTPIVVVGMNDGLIVKKNVHKHVLTEHHPNDTFINTTTAPLMPDTAMLASSILCAQQTLYDVKVMISEQSRVDTIKAAQALLVIGAVLYFISLIAICLSYKYIRISTTTTTPTTIINKWNYVRNGLAISVGAQIISFIIQLIGFFLYIYTDRAASSIIILFFNFGLAIFFTNITNFITIEYKVFKNRQISI